MTAVSDNNWYVLTGGPSTGKTTLLSALAEVGYATVPEAARTLIDNNLTKGISVAESRTDERYFQEEVTRLKQLIEASLDPTKITFFDRGMHDTLAYLRAYGYPIAPWIRQAAQHSHYQKVFLLEPLKTYEDDYARTEDETFRKSIRQLLHDAYEEYGMTPVDVPALPADQRLQFILNQLSKTP